jgi:hypothetical protein
MLITNSVSGGALFCSFLSCEVSSGGLFPLLDPEEPGTMRDEGMIK